MVDLEAYIENAKTAGVRENQMKLARSEYELNLTFPYGGGTFRADPELLLKMNELLGWEGDAIVEDNYGKPILIEDVEKFYDMVRERYASAIQGYYLKYEKAKKIRTVRKAIEE